MPITAFVRFDDPRLAMSTGHLHGTVELYDEDRADAVQVGTYAVPLESDPSAALAYRLEGAPIWDFEIAGFRQGRLFSSGQPTTAATSTGSSCCIPTTRT